MRSTVLVRTRLVIWSVERRLPTSVRPSTVRIRTFSDCKVLLAYRYRGDKSQKVPLEDSLLINAWRDMVDLVDVRAVIRQNGRVSQSCVGKKNRN